MSLISGCVFQPLFEFLHKTIRKMNNIITVETIHLRASRSLDVTLISNIETKQLQQKLHYIYNYEGVYFRVFELLNDFVNFIDGDDDKCICEFDNEIELENHLTLVYSINYNEH